MEIRVLRTATVIIEIPTQPTLRLTDSQAWDLLEYLKTTLENENVPNTPKPEYVLNSPDPNKSTKCGWCGGYKDQLSTTCDTCWDEVDELGLQSRVFNIFNNDENYTNMDRYNKVAALKVEVKSKLKAEIEANRKD